MLQAFENRLKSIAAEDRGDFHEKIRERAGKKATATLEKRLKNLILMTPKLLLKSFRHSVRTEVPSSIKNLTGFALTYFYHPKDFIPENNQHLFGYLDDAYYVGLLYERILKSLVRARLTVSDFDRTFLKQFGLAKRSVRLVIPDESGRIEQMINRIQAGEETALANAFEG